MSEEAVLSPVGWLKQTLPVRMPSLLTLKWLLNSPSPLIEWSRFKSTNRLPSPHSETVWWIRAMVNNMLDYEEARDGIKLD